MLNFQIDEKNGIAIFTPDEKLSADDFKSASNLIDPYIEQYKRLNGLIIYTESFPGWESFSGLVSHITFVKDHHKKIKRIALVTDSALGSLAESLSSHFVSAKIKVFEYSQLDSAKAWISSCDEV